MTDKDLETPAPSQEGAGVRLCARCGEAPRLTWGSWCRSCRSAAQQTYDARRRPRPQQKTGQCAVCESEMTWISGRGPDRVYCSRTCKVKSDSAIQAERRLVTDTAYREGVDRRRRTRGLAAQGYRECRTCHEVKTFAEGFHLQGAGHQRVCKACQQQDYRADPSEMRVRSYRSHVKRTFGLSPEDLHAMIIAQSGRCAACNDPMLVVHIDHDHGCCPGKDSCGRCIRGLLCNSCNCGLGFLRDDVQRLQMAIDYLNAHAERRSSEPAANLAVS
jgi:hypothetical protein